MAQKIMVNYLDNPSQLKEIFRIDDSSSTYKNFAILQDRQVGFSVEREYPSDIRFKSPLTKQKSPDVVASIHVVYAHPAQFGRRSEDQRIPIFISVVPFSRYLSIPGRHEYNYEDPDCPTEESLEISKSTPRPRNVVSMDEYHYDHITDTLQNKKGKIVAGKYILDRLFQKHCKTVKKLVTLRFRLIETERNIRTNIDSLLITVLIFLLDKLFGTKIDTKDAFSGTLKPYQKKDLKLETNKDLNIFGYKSSKNVIITYSFFVLLLFSLVYLFKLKTTYFKFIFSNALALICISILSLWMLETIVPALLFWLLNNIIKHKRDLMFKGIRI